MSIAVPFSVSQPSDSAASNSGDGSLRCHQLPTHQDTDPSGSGPHDARPPAPWAGCARPELSGGGPADDPQAKGSGPIVMQPPPKRPLISGGWGRYPPVGL